MISTGHRLTAAILMAWALGSGLLCGQFPDRDLVSAIALGERDTVVGLLRAGVSPRDCANRGESTLVQAIRHGRDDLILLLLEHQADPNEQEHGVFPVSLAAWQGNRPVLDRLIEWGADVNRCDAIGRTPLSWAILGARTESDHDGVIRRLTPLTRDTIMPFCDAAARGDVRALEVLSSAGAVVDAPLAASGRTALMEAAAQGQTRAVTWLLAHGARAQARDGHGRTALMLTGMEPCSREDMPGVFLGWAPTVTTGTACSATCASVLITAGGSVHERDASGKTPLMWAAMHGQTGVMRVLLRHGAPVDARSHAGDTALLWAAREGYADAVRTLLAAGADHRIQNQFQYSALSTAVLHHHDRVVETLLAAGADVNSRGIKGVTPLMLAVLKNQVSTLKLFVGATVDVTVTNDFGLTVLDIPKHAVVHPGVRSVLQHLKAPAETLGAKVNSTPCSDP